jgi:hydrogenase expression/formation protein HypC
MCLGIPGQIVELVDPELQLAKVDVCGVRRNVNIGLIADAPNAVCTGDWVLIHVGFALSRIDENEARATLDLLASLGEPFEQELDELRRSTIE